MPTSLPLLLLSGAYALSAESAWAFQSGTAKSVGSLRPPESSCGKPAPTRNHMLVSDERISMDVDLYDDDGEEIDVRTDSEKAEDDANEHYSSGGDIEKAKHDKIRLKRRLIECSASIVLPFSEDVAFDAFSDLTRQPSWCKFVRSVQYIGLVGDADEEDKLSDNIPLRKSKWTVGVKGLRFSWTSHDTRMVRPRWIEWESASGMKNFGSVEFEPRRSRSSSPSDEATIMTFCFTYVAPRALSSLFRRSGKIRKYTEDVLIMNMLTGFRDVVMEEDF